MTISSTDREAGPFIGNDSTTALPFDFKVFTAEDILVIRLNVAMGTESTLVLNTDYTVILNADQNANPGGTVTLTSPLATGFEATITSDLDYLQPTDLTNQGGFYPRVVNDALDRLTIFIQQILSRVNRSIKLPLSVTGVNAELPIPESNKIIGWNQTATGLQNIDAGTLATLVAYGTANADLFSGDGVETQFELRDNPGALNNLDVAIGGVTQTPGVDYTWASGLNISFTSPPPLGTNNILVRYMQGLPTGTNVASQVRHTPAGTGAVATTVESQLRFIQQQVVNVKDAPFYAKGDGVTDDTDAIQDAINSSPIVFIPEPDVSYLVSSISIPENKTVLTNGISTKFKQIQGVPTGTRVFLVVGSDVVVGDMTIEGNIATDIAEFNHAICVDSGLAGSGMQNIEIGNIKAVNIRGDSVYIGQTIADGLVTNVRVKSVQAENVLRNGVSIVGGSNIEVGQVTGSAVGYMHVDIEPDGLTTGNSYNVKIGQVKGRHIGMVLNNPSGDLYFNENIRFGEVDLDPAFSTQSTPPYSGGPSIASKAVLIRSLKSGFIGSLKVNGFDSSAISFVSGGLGCKSLVIDQATITDCVKNDAVDYGIIQCPNVTINHLQATTQAAPATDQAVFYTADNCVVLSGEINLGNNSTAIRSAQNCSLGNASISGAGASNTYVCLGADNTALKNCTISDVERLAGFMSGLELENTTATLSIDVLNTVTKVVYIKSTVQGQYYPFSIVDRTHTESLVIGGYFLWVDSTGDLRIKLGVPTSDTDGTVVGTQT